MRAATWIVPAIAALVAACVAAAALFSLDRVAQAGLVQSLRNEVLQ